MPMEIDDVRILIVDDDARNLDALEVMLESSGCSFVRAQSGDEALLAMLQHDFAAIILDIRMPGMSGIELAHLVKQRRRTRDVPILFLTAHLVDDADVLRGYGVGAVDYLSKPINADILRSKVAVFVELFRKTRAARGHQRRRCRTRSSSGIARSRRSHRPTRSSSCASPSAPRR